VPERLLPATLVGSYPQPDWLIDRAGLRAQTPPRVRRRELWRVAPEWLAQAQDDATLLALRDQEAAGLDVVTDGEIRRESYSNRFATALDGIDLEQMGTAVSRIGRTVAEQDGFLLIRIRQSEIRNSSLELLFEYSGNIFPKYIKFNIYYGSDFKLVEICHLVCKGDNCYFKRAGF
jgi:hypothetical protein